MYGWRGRIGHVEPSVWDAEGEWAQLMPDGMSSVVTTLGVTRLTDAQLDKAGEGITEAVLRLEETGADAISVGGSPLLTKRGIGADRELIAELAKVCRVPVTTSLTAAVEALTFLGAKRLAIATPYVEQRNEERRKFMEASGFEVLAIQGLGIERNMEIAKVPPNQAYQLGKRVFRATGDKADAVYFSCGRWPVVALLQKLEDDLGVPVVCSVQLQIWASLRLMKFRGRVEGFGRLMRSIA